MIKRLITIVLISVFLAGCSSPTKRIFPERSWNEEVLLLNGNIIVINYTRFCDYIGEYKSGNEYCGTSRRAKITFKNPNNPSELITFTGTTLPLVLNAINAQMYIIGINRVPDPVHTREKPMYVGYKLENNQWLAIEVESIPREIYHNNLTVTLPNVGKETLTILQKEKLLLQIHPGSKLRIKL